MCQGRVATSTALRGRMEGQGGQPGTVAVSTAQPRPACSLPALGESQAQVRRRVQGVGEGHFVPSPAGTSVPDEGRPGPIPMRPLPSLGFTSPQPLSTGLQLKLLRNSSLKTRDGPGPYPTGAAQTSPG